MFWMPLIFGAAAASGAIMQANGKNVIDPAWLEQHFGSHQFAQEFQKTFDVMQASPYGQAVLDNAIAQGQQMANTIRQNATAAGFKGAEGVTDGGSLFATSTADQAQASMRRAAMASIAKGAQEQASQTLDRRMQIASQAAMNQQTRQQQLGQALMGFGTSGLAAYMMNSGTPGTQAAGAGLNAASTAAASGAPQMAGDSPAAQSLVAADANPQSLASTRDYYASPAGQQELAEARKKYTLGPLSDVSAAPRALNIHPVQAPPIPRQAPTYAPIPALVEPLSVQNKTILSGASGGGGRTGMLSASMTGRNGYRRLNNGINLNRNYVSKPAYV